MFALVEWKDETETESWSIVPTSHIQKFNLNDFLDGLDESSVYLIEWRGGLKKKPKCGWPLYEATVHKVAERQSTLEKVQHQRTQHQSTSKPLKKRKFKPNPKFLQEETSKDGPSSPKKIEIHPGSGVYVPKNVLWSASHANSPTTMARMLLLGIFDIDTLLKSNLRGGKSKNASPGESKEPLDRIKIDAIMNAVIQKFPGTTRGQLGVAINQKVTELRTSKKTQT
ncbi:uncharacterized protein LOC143715516 [Siphateles boraxobius]|uniref:uncharacterized protein LOC143710349 n=1 Tax=Siphateles boraxobius TaxID=180520 RepID=UPI0040646B9D